MSILCAALAAAVLTLVLAWALARGLPRPLAVGLLVALLLVPAVAVTAWPLATLYLAVFTTIVAMRAVDLLVAPSAFGPGRTLGHLACLIDSRRIERVERAIDVPLILAGTAWFGVCLAGLGTALLLARQVEGPLHWALRWGGVATVFLAMFEAFSRWLDGGLRAFGRQAPKLHDSAFLSRSLREFWGVRWNKAVSDWLRAHVFEPFKAPGRAALGLGAAFVVSAAVHCYLAFCALGAAWAGVMGLFFLVQVALLALERRLGVARWPALAGRAWTLGTLFAASPLFCEPVARIFDTVVPLLDALR